MAALALHRGEPVGPDRLIDVIWGDDPPGNPGNALQALVATVRRVIGASNLTTSEAGYALALAPEDLDVARFERLVDEGCRRLEAGDAPSASGSLRSALELCRDEPLVEFAYAEFAAVERARLQELVLGAVEARVDADLALGRHAEVVGELEALCERHPLRERLWELRVLALYRAGRQADALRAYADARERLIEEFGIEPGPALRELEGRVLAQDPGLDPPTAHAGSRAIGPVGNVRQRLTSFVGRDAELGRLLESLDTCRLVTLIGPGGAGKTRLAVEAAAVLQSTLPDGAWVVELAGVLDPEGIAAAVAAGLELGRAERVEGSTVVDHIVGSLLGRTLVVVLDNCEHLVAEAAALTEGLLAKLPELRVVATSREALGVPGELLLPVGGLGLDAATDVFTDRARAVRPGFAVDESTRPLVEEVCRRLDGLPLAIELAAARLRALPLAQLAELLDDRFRVLTGGARTALPRQQTLRAVVDWSYDLLFEDERRLFARLSVFAGGWSLEAATAVCSDDLLPAGDIIDLLLHLVDKSLVVADPDADGGARYSQLQTLWHYARERLAETDDADTVRQRHAEWYLELAKGARLGLRGATGPVWRVRLATEWENLRVALDWFAERGDADGALALTEGVAWQWFLRGEPTEGARWLEDALAVPGGSPTARAIAVMWHAYYGAWIVGPGPLLPAMRDAIEVLRDAGADDRLGDALLMAVELQQRHEDAESADATLADALRVLERTGDQWGMAAAEAFVAQRAAAAGDLDAVEAAARSSVERLRAIGERWLVFEGLGHLALIEEARGGLEAAAAAYGQLAAEAGAAGAPNYEVGHLARLAGVRARLGDDETAAVLYERVSLAAIRPLNRGWVQLHHANVARRLGDVATSTRLLDGVVELFESLAFDLGCSAVQTCRCWGALGVGDADAAIAHAAEASRRAAVEPRSRVAAAAEIAGAAAAYAASGDVADLERLRALVDQRAGTKAGAYSGLLSGSMGEFFDEADVLAFLRSVEPALSAP